ncbi:Sulfatase-like protein [Phytophthora palmivora]|uniref:Sulfatase-like protein n=1 Tax=Phytophthora palmivora TaxID=4796 RepID=A0A2P4XXP4_9STRA|nr:Sulfatase-like protein [Phytophthora palmivora]
MEDFNCVTYLVRALWVFDTFKLAAIERWNLPNRELVFGKTYGVMDPVFSRDGAFCSGYAARAHRDMRFTLDLVATLIRVRHHLGAAPISTDEFQRGYAVAALLLTASTLFALARSWASWTDLACWNPTLLMANFQEQKAIGQVFKRAKYQEVALEEVQGTKSKLPSLDGRRTFVLNHAIQASIVFVALVGLSISVVAIGYANSPMVAYLALNATLKELFGHALQAAPTESTFVNVNGDLPWMEMYIHPTERGKLFGTLRLTVSLRISAAMLPLTLKSRTTTCPTFTILELIPFGSEIHSTWLEKLEKFLNRMKDEGILDDTIVVIYGDHGTA